MAHKLLVSNVSARTNLVVKLRSRTTKEEASKEVGRIQEAETFLMVTNGK